MKKTFIILFALLLIQFSMRGNGGPPFAYMSEFKIDPSGTWTLELGVYYPFAIDSIWISSSSSGSMVAEYTMIPPDEFLTVIGNENLVSPVTFDPQGDYIIVKSWGSGYWYVDSLAYGNYPGAIFSCINNGESFITSHLYYYGSCWDYSIDSSPTLGLENDTTGAVAYMSGTVYAPDGSKLYEGYFDFVINLLEIEIATNGSYYRPVFARDYYCDQIRVYTDWPYDYIDYYIEPIAFCARPGVHYEIDFITTGYVNIDDPEKETETQVIVSPNPFVSNIDFYWDKVAFRGHSNVQLYIYNPQGHLVLQFRLDPETQHFRWSAGSHDPSGMYIYQIKDEEGFITSGKIIKI